MVIRRHHSHVFRGKLRYFFPSCCHIAVHDNGRKKNENNNIAESECKNFTRTDDKVELLLGVIIHLEAECYDWESVCETLNKRI